MHAIPQLEILLGTQLLRISYILRECYPSFGASAIIIYNSYDSMLNLLARLYGFLNQHLIYTPTY